MIRRVVLLRYHPHIDRSTANAAVAAAVAARFPRIPGVLRAVVGGPADEASAASWDLALNVDFASLDAVGPYLAHPEHVAFVAAELEPRVQVKKAWNFDFPGA